MNNKNKRIASRKLEPTILIEKEGSVASRIDSILANKESKMYPVILSTIKEIKEESGVTDYESLRPDSLTKLMVDLGNNDLIRSLIVDLIKYDLYLYMEGID